jgi:hypothetical protein
MLHGKPAIIGKMVPEGRKSYWRQERKLSPHVKISIKIILWTELHLTKKNRK